MKFIIIVSLTLFANISFAGKISSFTSPTCKLSINESNGYCEYTLKSSSHDSPIVLTQGCKNFSRGIGDMGSYCDSTYEGEEMSFTSYIGCLSNGSSFSWKRSSEDLFERVEVYLDSSIGDKFITCNNLKKSK